jgi:hypothetical protein
MGSASFRKAFNISSKLLILLALIIVTLWKTDAASLASHLDLRILGYIILLQPLAFMCAVFLGKRYSVLLRSDEVRFGTAFKAVILSNGLNVVLPARLSELLKATYVNEKTGHSISKALSAVVLERIGDIIILLLLALACVPRTVSDVVEISSSVCVPRCGQLEGSLVLCGSDVWRDCMDVLLCSHNTVRVSGRKHQDRALPVPLVVHGNNRRFADTTVARRNRNV